MFADCRSDSHATLCADFRWQVPARFNLGVDVCGRWASDRSRFALYHEDESGLASAHTFHDIQCAANRLSNVLAALGTLRGDRVAIVLPQCPQAAIAHVAIYQMGAVAVPLSPDAGADALEFRLAHAGAHVAIVDETSWATLREIRKTRDRLPKLRHAIGVGPLSASGAHDWEAVLAPASPRYAPADTAADDPAQILYARTASGAPKGVLLAHRALLGNLPGFVCAHDFYPQAGDLLWSPADWSGSGGLWNALLPAWHFGQPLLACAGRFDAGKAFALIEKYGVRNVFLPPSALRAMMAAVPDPKAHYDIDLRTIASAGEPLGEALFQWAREKLGVGINEMFGQTGIGHPVGNCGTLWPVRPGAMGRAYPGHRVAVIDAGGRELPRGETGEIAVHRRWHGEDDPALMLGCLDNPAATRGETVGDGWMPTGDLARMDEDGYLWYRGRADAPRGAEGDRIPRRPADDPRQPGAAARAARPRNQKE